MQVYLGNWKTDKGEMDAIIGIYFDNLFMTESPRGFDEAMEGLEKLVTEDMCETLDQEPTAEEVRESLFQMLLNKGSRT